MRWLTNGLYIWQYYTHSLTQSLTHTLTHTLSQLPSVVEDPHPLTSSIVSEDTVSLHQADLAATPARGQGGHGGQQFGSLLMKDCYLVFRSLCRLSMKGVSDIHDVRYGAVEEDLKWCMYIMTCTWVCCVVVVCLTLLASFFLPSHLSLKHVYDQAS